MKVDSSPNPHKIGGLRRVLRAFANSMEGIGATFRHEAAFRQEALLALVLVPLAALLPVGMLAKALLIGSVFIVLIVELVNSAIEVCIDYVSLDAHPLAKRAKDMASAAVFFSLLNVAVVWGLVLADHYGAGLPI